MYNILPQIKRGSHSHALFKYLLIMKIILILMTTAILQVSASTIGYAQKITLIKRDATLEQVIKEIRQQSGYDFFASRKLMQKAHPVTVDIRDLALEDALTAIFLHQPLTFTLTDANRAVIIKEKPTKIKVPLLQDTIRGTVTDSVGRPLAGVAVRIENTRIATTTNAHGRFTLPQSIDNAVLVFQLLGYAPFKETASNNMRIVLRESFSALDEAVVIAYGTTTRRLNTGSVSRVTAEEIQRQPVNNVLGALSGRVPGLEVTQSSGAPGSSYSLQIRGRNSFTQGSEPLILIDGIPFASQNQNINNLSSSIGDPLNGGGLSPFYSINPSDIESIEVLKDADATAIYGSRGANGVILITTKKGITGPTSITANISQGMIRAERGMEMLSTAQYLEMRREAFANNNVEPDVNNAPDLTLWKQERDVDLYNELLGNTGHMSNAQLSLSGGNNVVQYLFGGNYFRETDVFPGNFPNSRGGANISLNHNSPDERFSIQFSGSYMASRHQTTGTDLTSYAWQPPNIPSFYDESGNLNWVDGVENPYSYLESYYKARIGHLNTSLNSTYRILPSLNIKLLAGYNEINNNDKRLFPLSSIKPQEAAVNSSQFGQRSSRSWNIEPQLEYNQSIWTGSLNVLFGTTLQETISEYNTRALRDFPNDALMESYQAAGTIQSLNNSYLQYRYQAFFGRLNYNVKDKYLLNLTGRRDGSSRFGPREQFGNFGAVGAAWIFTSEEWMQNNLRILSFGKLRGSYGVTGNDQIGDYQYLDSWQARGIDGLYQGITGLFPSNLFNPGYAWERNRKIEAALELGFIDNRILFNANYYNNRSSNQLIQYRLPYLTGFPSILMNFPALVENQGWEFNLNANVLDTRTFSWNTSFNITLPQNTLLEFPDFESSSYRSLYVIGEPLNVLFNYRNSGVNPETGLYELEDVNQDGTISGPDFQVNGSLDPKFYGGFRNDINYKGFQLEIFLDYRKQTGRNFLHSIYRGGIIRTPGTLSNQPVEVLDRWQNEGNVTTIERFSSIAHSNRANVYVSNAMYSDQSFVRLRNVSMSYTFKNKLLQTIHAKMARIYLQSQNLYTWNRDKGYNPETQDLYRLAPLKNFVLGVQLTY